MIPFNVGRETLAYIGTGISGGGVATALSVANEVVQLIAGLVAIAAGIASLLHFLRARKK